MIEEIKKRLASLNPARLEIIDDSHMHHGHAGNSGGGHFTIIIKSDLLAKQNRIQSHRQIYSLLDDLIPQKIHALQIKIEI
jgi:BolA protein